MTGRNDRNGSLTWLVVGLSAHGLAAVLLLANVLSSSEPGDTERTPPAASPIEHAGALPVATPAGGTGTLAAALEDD